MFSPWNLHGGRKEPTNSSKLFSVSKYWSCQDVCPYKYINCKPGLRIRINYSQFLSYSPRWKLRRGDSLFLRPSPLGFQCSLYFVLRLPRPGVNPLWKNPDSSNGESFLHREIASYSCLSVCSYCSHLISSFLFWWGEEGELQSCGFLGVCKQRSIQT